MASADVFNKGRLTLLLLVAHASCSREKGRDVAGQVQSQRELSLFFCQGARITQLKLHSPFFILLSMLRLNCRQRNSLLPLSQYV